MVRNGNRRLDQARLRGFRIARHQARTAARGLPAPRDPVDSNWIDMQYAAVVDMQAQKVLPVRDRERGERLGVVAAEYVQRNEQINTEHQRAGDPAAGEYQHADREQL